MVRILLTIAAMLLCGVLISDAQETSYPSNLVVNLSPPHPVSQTNPLTGSPLSTLFADSTLKRIIVTRHYGKMSLEAHVRTILAFQKEETRLESIRAAVIPTHFAAIVVLKNGKIIKLELGETGGYVRSPKHMAQFQLKRENHPTKPSTATEQEQVHKVIAEPGGARSLGAILEKDREVHIRINQYTHLYMSADGKYTYSTGPNPLSGISSHGTWKASGRFILMTGDWQPVNAASMRVTKSLKVYIGLLRRDPQFPEFYEGWFYVDEIKPVSTERNAEAGAYDGG